MVARWDEQLHRGAALVTELHGVSGRIRSRPRLVDARPRAMRAPWCYRPTARRSRHSFTGFCVPEVGVEPTRFSGRRIFVPLRLSPPRATRVRGLEHAFTVAMQAVGARRLLSTPSLRAWRRAWLGVSSSG